MIPINQTEFDKTGNCFRACIASIFGIPLTGAPNLVPFPGTSEEEQNRILNVWLKNYNMKYLEIRIDLKYLKDINHLIIGTSPRDVNLSHVVVGRSGKMVHDPHPDKSGVKGFLKYGVFVIIQPSESENE